MSYDAEGRLFDGQSARPLHVNAIIRPAGLELFDEDGQAVDIWPLDLIADANEGNRADHVYLLRSDQRDARLDLKADGLRSKLEQAAPQLTTPNKLKRYTKPLMVSGGVLLASMVFVLMLPSLASLLAPVVPDSWFDPMGERMTRMIGQIGPYCDAPDGVAALQTMADRINADDAAGRDLTIRVSSIDMVNAFAMPGGNIVLFKGLIDAAQSPEEVTGVLAHEVGHIREDHIARSAITRFGLASLSTIFTGNTTAGDIAAGLAGASYSRDQEREADQVALELMARSNVGADGFADFFERLDEIGDGDTVLERLIMSHPPTKERAALARHVAAARREPTVPVLTDDQWQSLKDICSSTMENPD